MNNENTPNIKRTATPTPSAQRLSNDPEPSEFPPICIFLNIIAWFQLIAGFVAGAILDASGFSLGVCFAVTLSSIVGCVVLLGFSKIVKTLLEIKDELVLIRKK